MDGSVRPAPCRPDARDPHSRERKRNHERHRHPQHAVTSSSLLTRLSLEEKVRLLTGADAWSLYAIDTVGLRSMVVSDGPSGVRGRRFDPRQPVVVAAVSGGARRDVG